MLHLPSPELNSIHVLVNSSASELLYDAVYRHSVRIGDKPLEIHD
jgi:hypothetical protein